MTQRGIWSKINEIFRKEELLSMANIRFHVALIAAKLSGKLIRLLGRNGSHTPGAIAMRICPDFLGLAPRAKLVVCVTGTNGKTSVSNMISDALEDTGRTVASNRAGSNIVPGCCTNLINSLSWTGKCRVDATVFETDERASRLILPHLKPDYMIVTNLSRDTPKRNAHTDYIFSILDTYCPDSVKLILNADDPCSSQLRPGNQRVFFGIDRQPGDHTEPYNIIADNTLCPKCGTRFEYEYLRYHHIGKVKCPHCGFKSYDADYLVTDIDRENGQMTTVYGGQEVQLPLISPMMHNIYNEAAIVALLDQIGISREQITSILAKIHLPDSRFNETKVGNQTVDMMVIKGPIPVSRNFEFVASQPEDKTVILEMDDQLDRRKSSEYMGWIYDVEYDQLIQDNIKQIIITGPHCYDHKARLLLAGCPEDRIVCVMDEIEAMDHVLIDGVEKIYLLFDLTSLSLARQMKQKLVERMEGKNEN